MAEIKPDGQRLVPSVLHPVVYLQLLHYSNQHLCLIEQVPLMAHALLMGLI